LLRVPVYSDLSPKAIRELVDRLGPACVVVSSYDRILPADLLAKCPFVNVHYAALPKYRGRANVNWAIINGEGYTGITIHTMAPQVDAGDILFQRLIPIDDGDTVADLYERLNSIQRSELGHTVLRLLDGDVGAPQDDRSSSYGCTRLPDDGAIDWSASTMEIDRLIRGLTPPYPGAFTYFEGARLVVWKAEPVRCPPDYQGRVPGRVISVGRQGHVDVLTGDGVLRLIEVQREGGEPRAAGRLIRSVKTTLGLRTWDLLRRIEGLERELAILRQEIRSGGAASPNETGRLPRRHGVGAPVTEVG
jgi:methionyl-tRNA formyltransferase